MPGGTTRENLFIHFITGGIRRNTTFWLKPNQRHFSINLRYRLFPYIYSLGHEAYRTGAPIVRPLLMEYPDDTEVANLSDEMLLGKVSGYTFYIIIFNLK